MTAVLTVLMSVVPPAALARAAAPPPGGGPPPAHAATAVGFQAWLYPAPAGSAECSAEADFVHGGLANGVLKAEYVDVDDQGHLSEDLASNPSNACNGYSGANAALVKAHSAEQFVTVSLSTLAQETALTANPGNVSTAVATLTSFVRRIGFTGVDIDFENYWSWVGNDQANYYAFLRALATGLHADGLELQVDGPGDLTTGFNYGKVLAAGADQVIMMDYDFQDPSPPGPVCPPITPLAWLKSMVTGARAQIPAAERSRLVIGLPSYGYVAADRCQHITGNVFLRQMRTEPGYSSDPAVVASRRDGSSGEIRWRAGGKSYDFVDQTAMDDKLAVVEAAGATTVSVWVLGGQNPWFATSFTG
jgi:spore germination protein YaaH